MRNSGRTGAVLVILLLLLGSGMVGLASAQTGGTKETPEPTFIKKASGTTDRFGGGDYVAIKFGNGDAMFGVLYGTSANPNGIIVWAEHRRYLGGAQVYDDNGASLGTVPIPVYQVWGQKLDTMFEFNDTNNDGLINYKKRIILGYESVEHEPIYKKSSLSTAWTASPVTETIDAEQKKGDWSFTVTATNLPYAKVRPLQDVNTTGALDTISFTFRLHAELVHVDNATVPMYKVTVKKDSSSGQYEVVSSTKIDPVTVSGAKAKYSGKYDHTIKGWDFDASNAHPRLLLEWYALSGFWIPPKVASWIKAQFINQTGGADSAEYSTDAGTATVDGRTAPDEKADVGGNVRKFKDPWVKLGDGWQKIGTLSWVDDVTVDGAPGKMYAQIVGGRKVSFRGPQGGLVTGFAVHGGYSYPGGQEIVHDPSLGGDVLVSAAFASPIGGKAGRGAFVLLIGVVVVGLVAVGGIAYAMKSKKAKQNGYDGSIDTKSRRTGPGAGDWERDYDRGKPPV